MQSVLFNLNHSPRSALNERQLDSPKEGHIMI